MIAILALSTAGWSGLSAILGALVGGTATGVATYKIEGRRQSFERTQRDADREREDAERMAVVRGVARVMKGRYHRYAVLVQTGHNFGGWLPDPIELQPSPSPEDRKLIAASTNAKEWTTIEGAEFVFEVFLIQRAAVFREGRRELKNGAVAATEVELEKMAQTIGFLERADLALDRLAGVARRVQEDVEAQGDVRAG